MKSKLIVRELRHCARCGGTHRAVLFHRLKAASALFTHWGMCPKLKEPLMMCAKIVVRNRSPEGRPE